MTTLITPTQARLLIMTHGRPLTGDELAGWCGATDETRIAWDGDTAYLCNSEGRMEAYHDDDESPRFCALGDAHWEQY